MAEEIAAGIKAADPSLSIKLFNVASADKNDVIAEVFKAKMDVAGSSTINKGFLSAMAADLEIIKGLQLKNKKTVAFGSYGWSGESPKQIQKELIEAGFEVWKDPLGTLWNPDEEARETCREFGRQLAEWVRP
jgi:flavorubredoxin